MFFGIIDPLQVVENFSTQFYWLNKSIKKVVPKNTGKFVYSKILIQRKLS